MADKSTALTEKQIEFIQNQKMFFVGTAANSGKVNISPKGLDTFKIVNSNKVVWLNLTGSGNETAAHLLLNDRMTIMFCSFERKPMIIRIYGHAKIFHKRNKIFHDYIDLFPAYPGARQIIEMHIDLVQKSCGYAVPFMDFKEERSLLQTWTEKRNAEQMVSYQKEKNAKSIDGFDTNIFKD